MNSPPWPTRGTNAPPRTPPPSNTDAVEKRVFISNVHLNASWEAVTGLFEAQIGPVSYVNLFKDKEDQVQSISYANLTLEKVLFMT